MNAMTEHTTGTRKEWLDARLTLLKAEKEHTRRADELARQRPVLDILVALHLDEHAEIRHVRAVIAYEIAAIDHVLLRDADQHVLERDQFRHVVLFDLLQVIPEPRLSGAPMRHGVAIRCVRALELRLVPVHVEGRIPFEIQRLLVGLTVSRIEDKLGRAP